MNNNTQIDAETEEQLSRIVRVNQLIVGGLIAGALFLVGMLVVMQQSGVVEKQDNDQLPVIAMAAAGFAAMSAAGRVFVGLTGTIKDDGNTAQTSRNSGLGADISDPFIQRVAANWTTGNIVRNAMTEGAAIFNGVAYMIDGQIWSIAISGALLAWMVVAMPRMSSLKQRIEERQMDTPPEPIV